MARSYPSDHWANDPDPASALTKARVIGEEPFNLVKWRLLSRSLIPQDLTGLRVLDYGCGVGGVAVRCALRGARVVGIDLSESALNTARHKAAKAGVSERCEFLANPFIVGSDYDLIICKDVIEHLDDDDAWMAAASRALTPRGRLICSTQNALSLNYLLEGGYHRWWRGDAGWMGWDPTHVRFYTPGTLRRLLKRHGLRVERWASHWIIPYNIVMWLTLLRIDLSIPSLKYFDYAFGQVFPFNRLGFGLSVVARKE